MLKLKLLELRIMYLFAHSHIFIYILVRFWSKIMWLNVSANGEHFVILCVSRNEFSNLLLNVGRILTLFITAAVGNAGWCHVSLLQSIFFNQEFQVWLYEIWGFYYGEDSCCAQLSGYQSCSASYCTQLEDTGNTFAHRVGTSVLDHMVR